MQETYPLTLKTQQSWDIKSNFEDISTTTYYSYINALKKLFVIDNIDAWSPNIRSKSSIRSISKKQFIDPSIAVAAQDLSPQSLEEDLNLILFLKTYVFET